MRGPEDKVGPACWVGPGLASRAVRGRTRTATLPPWVVLRQVVNHTTYHRGQMASKLKRFGVVQPETNLVFWAFEHFPQSHAEVVGPGPGR
jgi:DinB family